MIKTPKQIIEEERQRLLDQHLPAVAKTKGAGMVQLHSRIRHLSGGGEELVDFAFEILRNSGNCYKMQDRITMHKWLTEYGFGKPKETIEVQVGEPEESSIDLSTKTPEQLAELESHIRLSLALAKKVG